MNRVARWTLCTVVVTAFVAAGCDSMDKDKDGEKDRDKIARREERRRQRDRRNDPDPVIARDRDTRDRDTRDRGMSEIPSTATEVEGGASGRLDYEPSRNGVIYVYDADAARVIYVGRLRDREQFRFDPDAGRAAVNSKTVFRSDVNPRHRYRLYFDRAE
jgi:hypothetical protein